MQQFKVEFEDLPRRVREFIPQPSWRSDLQWLYNRIGQASNAAHLLIDSTKPRISQGLSALKRVFIFIQLELKKPLDMRKAIIIGIIVWVFWPNHHAIGISQPPAVKLPSNRLKMAQIELQPQKPEAVISEVTSPPIVTITNCGDNQYKQFIYSHESGCNPASVNAIGCRGIGQACPGDKLPCGADFACQDEYFTNYANKYGGWVGAYKFWLSHGWW